MKTSLLFTGLLLFITACNFNRNKQDEGSTDSISADNPTGALWGYEYDSVKQDYYPVKLKEVDQDTLNAGTVTALVNKTWPDVQVNYLKTSNDTVFITIPNSTVLTQQMGTEGAEEFMVTTTYSYTELHGIDYVSFSFEGGDHANPGVYNRAWWDNK